jgi:hypothetical protein
LASGTETIAALNAGDDSTVTFSQGISLSNAGRYTLSAYINQVVGDLIRLNDSATSLIKVLDTTKFPLVLDYTNQTPTAGGISWSGGNAGVGIYIEPPFYPARIVAANYYIANAGNTGFYSVIYDDDARGGGPGTILDSIYFARTQIAGGMYIRDSLRNNIVINSGGIYLHWLMGNGNIILGTTFQRPVSNQTFEVIGGAWAPYRSRDVQDFLMNIEVQPLSVGLEKQNFTTSTLSIYPNPSNNYIDVTGLPNSYDADVQLVDLQGKAISVKVIPYDGKLRLFKGSLKSGQYILRINEETKPILFTD